MNSPLQSQQEAYFGPHWWANQAGFNSFQIHLIFFPTQAHICVNTETPHCDHPLKWEMGQLGRELGGQSLAWAWAHGEGGGFVLGLITGKGKSGLEVKDGVKMEVLLEPTGHTGLGSKNHIKIKN